MVWYWFNFCVRYCKRGYEDNLNRKRSVVRLVDAATQVEAQPIVPQVPKEVHLGHVLPEEVLLVHVLPHLGDYSLAIAACFSRAWRRMAGEVTAARRELVRELLRGRRSDLPLMLVWSCPRLSYGGKVHITIAALQLALGQGALTFSPCIRNKSLWTPEWESSRWMITGHPRVTLDPQQRTPDDVRWADPVRPYTASEASAEVDYMEASMGRRPVLTARFSDRPRIPTWLSQPGTATWKSQLNLHDMCVLQPGWLAVLMVEADAQFLHRSWPEACAAAEAGQLFGESLKRRLKACCDLDTSTYQAGWPHTWW